MAGQSALSAKLLAGRIKSVYCKDFVSYNEITFHPKHYLNVLTGPNGSGKSTIVSAIILGLGGEPALLDRSSSVADYIRSNKTTATIIVRVYGRAANSTESFRRIINTNGSSIFSVNGQEISKRNFLSTIASYNIQVSNLCQFLPQDRVQDFSKMNPQELLLNTMSSVCDDELTNIFALLKEMRKKQANVHADCENEKNDLQKKQKRLEQLHMSVAQYKEREELNQKLQIYSAKKLWIEAEAGVEKANQCKSNVEKAKLYSEKLKKQYDSEVRTQEEVQRKKSVLKKTCLEKTRSFNEAIAHKNTLNCQLESIKQGIREQKCVYEQNIQKSIKNAMEADKLKQLVENKNEELEAFNKNKATIMSDLERIKESWDSARRQAMKRYNIRKELETSLNDEKIPEITAYRHKIERLQNVKTQKLEEIRLKIPNLFRAMTWVSQNKQKYKLNIYDPMILELSMQSDDGCKYLENVVKQRDLFAFACEDKEDMSDLINELCVKQKLGVNIIFCAPVDRCLYSPNISKNELRALGFHANLVDLVTGPLPIINKLCASYAIHNIPIGSNVVSNHTSSIPKHIRVYFRGDKKFVVTASRYRSDSVTTESTIRGKNQLISVDSRQLAAMRKMYSDASKECDNIRNAITITDNEFEHFQTIAKDKQDKKRKLEQKITHFNSLRSEVETLTMKLSSLIKINDLNEVKTNYKTSVVRGMKKIQECETKMCIGLKKMSLYVIAKIVAQTNLSIYRVEHESQSEVLREIELQSKTATRDYNQLLGTLEQQMSDIYKRKTEMQKLCNGEIPTSSKFPYIMEFKSMEYMTLAQVREAIHDFQARLECMKNVNSETIDSYQELQNEVKRLENCLQKSSNQSKTIESEISSLYDKWKPRLTNLVETISTKFSEFMESIEYVGEVVLSKADKYDFDSYGIQIMVQFRKDVQLQPLDKFIQSGGERAVSIAIYSLSLQHVTHVPFRCVDEINQGMDAKNERHIFDLLLNEATKHGSAQYLFVTPKLLRDLNYNEHLCVSIVHNSKTIDDGMEFPTI